MSIMIAGLYEALKDAGAKEHLAKEAAKEVANYDNRLNKMERDLAVLKWMVGFNMAMTATVLFKLFEIS